MSIGIPCIDFLSMIIVSDSLAEAIKVIQSENKDLNVPIGLTESTARYLLQLYTHSSNT